MSYLRGPRIHSVKDCNLGDLALKASQATENCVSTLSIWVDGVTPFEQEFNALKKIAKSNALHNVEAVIVGSEVMHRGDVSSEELLRSGSRKNAFICWEGVMNDKATETLIEHYRHVVTKKKALRNARSILNLNFMWGL
ncbi:hypothetical protein BD770DRAFT_407002 [Pilaira anomala]|nr:hypothetical protein BD770DRAFT_407002 [Pilaira anomala]